MFIQEMTREECLRALTTSRLGRLACAHDNQPYVVPVFFGYSEPYIYGFGTLGQRIEWMRGNPRVCLEVDEVVSPSRWMSVVVLGTYQELPDTPEWEAARWSALRLLQTEPMWWEPGAVRSDHRDPAQPLTPVYYRILIDQVTGRRSAGDAK